MNNASTSDVTERKVAARKAAFARRKDARAASPQADAAASRRLVEALACPPGAVVAGYRPIRTELDPTAAMLALLEQDCRVCAPVVVGPGQPLRFRLWSPETPMEIGDFGVEVPARGAWVAPAVLITPLAAFDRAGYRLGYGGGFYDRTLAELRQLGSTTAVGFAFAAQEVDSVPREATDAPLDAIVTELETIEFTRAAFSSQ